MMNYDSVILLTACVNPEGMAFTKLQDANVRLNQYKKALTWYLQATKLPIVVVENTMTDFSDEFSEYIRSGRLEFLTFNGNQFDKSRGKGYGEALIIKYGIEHSHILKQSKRLIKVTGRLVIKNLKQLYGIATCLNDVYANTILLDGRCMCVSYFFIAPIEFMKEIFLNGQDRLNDSKYYYFEHLLFDSTLAWTQKGHKLKMFCFPILIEGMSGTSGKAYIKPKFAYTRAFIVYVLARLGFYKNYIHKQDSLKS
jgi:hypothetical protein